jgi:uncharacterized membrane protein
MEKLNIILVELSFLHLIKQFTMSIKKIAIGGITAGIIFFFLGWLIYGNLLMDYMKAHPGVVSGYERVTPDMIYLVIGNLLSGLLMAYIFTKANINTLVNGLITGAIVGLLMAAAYDSMNYALTNLYSKTMIVADVLATVILSGITGAITGWVMGKIK